MTKLLNYTTTVPAETSAGQVIALLVRHGARRINQEYSANGKICGVSFCFELYGFPVFFTLPANEEGTAKVMRGLKPSWGAERLKEHSRRVAWRILKDWTEAQIALVECGQAQMAQVFLPYAEHSGGRSVFAVFDEQYQQKQLGAGK